MTQPVQEPSTDRSLSSARWGNNQLFRRPAPPTATPAGVQYWEFGSTITTSGSGFTDFSWGAQGGDNDGTSVDLTGANKIRINASGVYSFHLVAHPAFYNPNVDTSLDLLMNVTSGTVGLWSSKWNGSEANAEYAGRINRAGSGININSPGQGELFAYSLHTAGFTFPKVLTFQVDVLEDLGSVARSVTALCTVIRFGDTFS